MTDIPVVTTGAVPLPGGERVTNFPSSAPLPVPKPVDASSGGSLLVLIVAAVLFLGGMISARMAVNGQVGLTYPGAYDSSYTMPINCGSKLEWVIGGGPAFPSNSMGLSSQDARSECHAQYDSDISKWRTRFWISVVACVIGALIGMAAAKS